MVWIVVAAIVLILIIFVYKESSGFNIVEYNLYTGKDIKGPVRFVMLSDLHDTDVTHDGNARLLEAIKGLEPEFVVLAGDMITSYSGDSYGHDKAFGLLKGLAESFSVYYGLGNHEQRYKAEPERFPGRFSHIEEYVKELGITFLDDDHADMECGIRIYGFDVPIDNYRRVVHTELPDGILPDTLGRLDDDRYNIVIAHNPDFFEDYVSYGPDLVLAGHLHGGVIAIPGIGGIISPQLKPFPKYDFGTFTKNDTTMIVSRGIGWHSIPIRIFNKAEIVAVNILPQGETVTDVDKR